MQNFVNRNIEKNYMSLVITELLLNESSTLMLPFRMRAPFDLTNIRNAALVYAGQIPLLCVAVFYAASICLFITLVFNVCIQLSVLSHRIINLKPGSNDIGQKFSKFVEKHLRVIW